MDLRCPGAPGFTVDIDVELLHAPCIFLALLVSLLTVDGLCHTGHSRDRSEYQESNDHVEATCGDLAREGSLFTSLERRKRYRSAI